MNSSAIIYPSIAMFALTIGCIFSMGIARYRGIHAGDVSIKFYRTYTEGAQPERLHLLMRHVQNHFEVPPLFHIAVLFLYTTATVTTATVVIAWLYVAARYVHTAIHLGGNNVSRRFFVFGGSLIFLTALWGLLLWGLL